MGKSPGKWIKSVLFGKKSSKSSLSNSAVKRSANAHELLVPTKLPESDGSATTPLVISHPLSGAFTGNEEELNSGKSLVTELSHEIQEGDDIDRGSQNDRVIISHEKAVSKLQAACRGYLARRAFRTLKGILKLQALVRGHMIRRQAVATLCCVLGIVKFQALVRGQKVRRSGVASEVHKKQSTWINMEVKSSTSTSVDIITSARPTKLSKNAFVRKLLASSPIAMPLRLQYGTREPNCAWKWLEHWTRSHCWEPYSEQKKILDSKSQLKPGSIKPRTSEQQGMRKRGTQKHPTPNVENGSTHSTSELEKIKRSLKKLSSHSTKSTMKKNPQIELSKVKRNSKNVSNSTIVSDQLLTQNEKPVPTQTKASSSVIVAEPKIVDSAEKINLMTEPNHTYSMKYEEISDSKHIVVDDINDPSADLQPIIINDLNENSSEIVKELSSKTDQMSDENQKLSRRRASLPAKPEGQENGVHYTTPRVPSYMAATESAKAKLRMQASMKFGDDVAENNGFTRRHSLPLSVNGKLISLSPRIQKLVQANGKVGIRTDKSLTSSTDGNDKVIQPGWRR